MTCEEIRPHLDEFVNGELADSEQAAVQEHVGTCLSCRRELLEIRGLLAAVEDLPAELAPERDLWPAIRMNVVATGRSTSSAAPKGRREHAWWHYLAAAGIALVALSTPLSMWWMSRPTESEEAARVVDERHVAGPAAENATPALALLARSEDGVLQTRIDLVSVLESRRPTIEPETAAVMETHIRIMDDAIAEIRAALTENPDDARLMRLLATRYQQEAALLHRYSRV